MSGLASDRLASCRLIFAIWSKAIAHEKTKILSHGKIKNRISNHDRPAEVDAKERIGDWPINCTNGLVREYRPKKTDINQLPRTMWAMF